MEVEVQLDPASVRRHHRRTLVFVLAIALAFASYLVRPVVAVILGAGAGEWEWVAHAMILTGFVTALSSPLWGSWDMISYRCPRCRRRLSRVSPEGVAEANYHYLCMDCHVIWDLGWVWHGGGEGGG